MYYLINLKKNQLILIVTLRKSYNQKINSKIERRIKNTTKHPKMKKKLMAICEFINVCILWTLLFSLTEAGK